MTLLVESLGRSSPSSAGSHTSSRAVVVTVLLLALLLRAAGIGYGIPHWMVNDELPLIGGAMRMLELRNPIPTANAGPMSILYYPPGLPWLYLIVWAPLLAVQWVLSGFVPLEAFADRVLSDFGALWIAARAVSVAFSVGTVWIVMRLADAIFRDRLAAAIAGLLMATSFHHGLIGHFARVWPATLFLWWLGFWMAWRIHVDGRRSDYLWAAVAAGAGFLVNYVGVLVSLAVAVAHGVRHRRIAVDRAILAHAAVVAAFIAIGLATSWPTFLRLAGYSTVLREALAPGVSFSDAPSPLALLWFYPSVMAKADPLLVAMGLAGLPLLVRAAPVLAAAFAATMIPYALLLITGSANDDRYVLPFTPLLAIAGGALVTLRSETWRRAVLGAIGAVILVQAATLARLDWLMLRPDTRELAREWLDENVPVTQGVIASMRSLRLEQSLRSIELERELAPGSLTYLQRRRLEGAVVAAGGGGRPREAVHLRTIGEDALGTFGTAALLDRLLSAGYRWYVVDDVSGPVGGGELEAGLIERMELVARITPGGAGVQTLLFNNTNQLERGGPFGLYRARYLGPRVDIYRLR